MKDIEELQGLLDELADCVKDAGYHAVGHRDHAIYHRLERIMEQVTEWQSRELDD